MLKLVLILLSIVLGVITFRNNYKVLGVLTLLIFVYTFSLSYSKSPDLQKHTEVIALPENTRTVAGGNGKAIYETNCISCHGADGTAGLAGASNLQKTKMGEEEIINTIANGKNNMPAFSQFSKNDTRSVAEYLTTLGK